MRWGFSNPWILRKLCTYLIFVLFQTASMVGIREEEQLALLICAGIICQNVHPPVSTFSPSPPWYQARPQQRSQCHSQQEKCWDKLRRWPGALSQVQLKHKTSGFDLFSFFLNVSEMYIIIFLKNFHNMINVLFLFIFIL